MGISIDVESIITLRDRHPYGLLNYQEYQYTQVQRLCDAFGWSRVPWLEPSPIRGLTNTSCNSVRYYRLLNIARAHARDAIVCKYNEEQPLPLTPKGAQLFPHLLIRAIWSNYYLPVAFDQPRIFEGVSGSVSAGSVMGLQRELTYIAVLLRDLYRLQETVDSADQMPTAVMIQDAQNLCDLLLDATRESIDLQLPLLLRG